jgi:hypothetical protein
MFFCKESPRKTLLYKLDEEIIRDVLVDLADITYNFSSTSIDFFSLENSFDILLAMNNNDDAIGIKYDTKEVDRSSIAYYDKENTKPFKKHINNQLIYFLKFKLKTLLEMSIKYIGEDSVAHAPYCAKADFIVDYSENIVFVAIFGDIKNKKFIQNYDIYNTPIPIDSWGVDWNIIKPQQFQTTI